MRPGSRAVHAGRDPRARDPLAPPIVQTSVHVYEELEDYDAVARGDRPGHVYGRNSNENVAMLERAVAELEGADSGVATASGMGAILCSLLALAPRPGPIVAPKDVYGGTLQLIRSDLEPLGYELRSIDLGDAAALRAALAGAGVLICETVTNPLCRVADVPAVTALAHAAGVPVVVDNTFATPILFRPLEHGATAAVHSATKYIGGHSDLVAGVVVGSDRVMSEVRPRSVRLGTTLGPFEAWLALRGLRTLELRVHRQSRNARILAQEIASMPGVERVHHPGLPGSPDHELAARLLPDGTGGMFSFDLEGGRERVQAMMGRLRFVRFAASLGGVETTISHPEVTSHRSLAPEERAAAGIGGGTVRVSTGIEDPEDLVDEFRQALSG